MNRKRTMHVLGQTGAGEGLSINGSPVNDLKYVRYHLHYL